MTTPSVGLNLAANQGHIPKIITIGSTVYDRVLRHDTDTLDDVKEDAKFGYKAVGGGGANVARTISLLANALNIPVNQVLYTMLGRPETPNDDNESHPFQNPHRENALSELQGINVQDLSDKQRFRVANNTVISYNKGRFISKDPLASQFNRNIFPAPKMIQKFAISVAYADFVFAQSRWPDAALAGVHAVTQAEEELGKAPEFYLDFDARDPERAKALEPVIQGAHCVFAPDNALAVGMNEEDSDMLFEKLKTYVDDPNCRTRMISVSGGKKGVRAYIQGVEHSIPTTPDLAKDANGNGDARDGFFALAKRMGLDDLRASIVCNQLAGLSVSQIGREWEKLENLIPHMINHNIFSDHIEALGYNENSFADTAVDKTPAVEPSSVLGGW